MRPNFTLVDIGRTSAALGALPELPDGEAARGGMVSKGVLMPMRKPFLPESFYGVLYAPWLILPVNALPIRCTLRPFRRALAPARTGSPVRSPEEAQTGHFPA